MRARLHEREGGAAVPGNGETEHQLQRLPLPGPLPAPRPERRARDAGTDLDWAQRLAGRDLTVRIAVEDLDELTGVRHRRVVVDDESALSPTRERNHGSLALLDDLLRANPGWDTPRVVDGEVLTGDNPAAAWVYASATMREWRARLVPSAMALYPVQRGGSHLPSGAPMDEMAHRVLVDSLDAIGIRTRARVMGDVVRRATAEAGPGTCGEPRSWVSLACGAAVPVLDALATLPEARVHLQLVDLDAEALAFARSLAAEQGLVEGRDVTLLQRDLVRSVVAGTGLLEELGEGRHLVVEALGIFEYFTDASCVRLLRNAHRLLRPGGVLVVGNMLADRPELAFNQRGAGWPRLFPRSTEQLVDLVRRAGLPLERTTVSVPEDGVYAVVDVRR